MAILDLYESSEHRNNIAHFAAIVNLATVDGTLNVQEENIIKRFANKLDISQEEYKLILKNPANYQISPSNSAEERLERIYDLFKIIYADNHIDDPERKLVLKYAIALGYSNEKAQQIIQKSIRLFGGELDFEEYQYFINK